MGLQTFGKLEAVSHQNNDSQNPGPCKVHLSAVKPKFTPLCGSCKASSGAPEAWQRARGFKGPAHGPPFLLHTDSMTDRSLRCFGSIRFLRAVSLRMLSASESLSLSQASVGARTPPGSRPCPSLSSAVLWHDQSSYDPLLSSQCLVSSN